MRYVVAWLIESVVGDKIYAAIVRAVRHKSVGEYNALYEQKDIYEKLFYEEVSLLMSESDGGPIVFVGRFGTSKNLMGLLLLSKRCLPFPMGGYL